MDALHEIMRNDKSDQLKINKAQQVLIDSLNEVKATLLVDTSYLLNLSYSREKMTTPEVKNYSTKNTKNDDQLIKSVEEALLIVRQDSCQNNNFKSQRSFTSIEPRKTSEHEYSNLLKDKNSRSNCDLRKSNITLNKDVISEVPSISQDNTNGSFGQLDPLKIARNDFKYKIEYLGRSKSEQDSFESEESEPENVGTEANRELSLQTSDDDEIVDSVLNKITSYQHSNKQKNQRYRHDHSMPELEFTNETMIRKSSDLYVGFSSKESTLDRIEVDSHQQSGFNLPLQIIKNDRENTCLNIKSKQECKNENEIELAV
jgi:hypothetical protein